MSRFLIILNGPMCAGKTTVCELIMHQENVFMGSYNTLKWLISNYSEKNQDHRDLAKQLTFSTIKKAIENNYSIVIDHGGNKENREYYKNLAKENNLNYLSINIEAPIDTLEKRFFERLKLIEKTKENRSVKTLEGFHHRYQKYLNENKDPRGHTFDSSKLSPEEIVLEIKKIKTI